MSLGPTGSGSWYPCVPGEDIILPSRGSCVEICVRVLCTKCQSWAVLLYCPKSGGSVIDASPVAEFSVSWLPHYNQAFSFGSAATKHNVARRDL